MTLTEPQPPLAQRIDVALRRRSGRHVWELQVVVRDRGVVLRGRTLTYYAKQMAQQVATEVTGLPVLANEIVVR